MDDPERPLNLDRLRRLGDFWNWLPAFRAVAETEHVRTAAERLNVSPSALSRSIGLLEDAVGHQLFDREGRGIKLNRAGHEFLLQLRAAMRLIDDGLNSLQSNSFTGSLRLCAPDDLMGRLWKGLRKLRETNPDLTIELHQISGSAIQEHLLGGSLDLAFNQRPRPADGVLIEPFLESSNAIYCGTNHELAGRAFVTMDLVLEHGFVAGIDSDGVVVDGWPPELKREVVASVPRLQAAVEACAFGGLLGCLPVHVAEPYCERGLLFRVPVSEIGASVFFVSRRTPVNDRDRNAAHVADLLKAAILGEVAPGQATVLFADAPTAVSVEHTVRQVVQSTGRTRPSIADGRTSPDRAVPGGDAALQTLPVHAAKPVVAVAFELAGRDAVEPDTGETLGARLVVDIADLQRM